MLSRPNHPPSAWHATIWRNPRTVVEASAVAYRARAPYALAHAPARDDLDEAWADAQALEDLFARCPPHQWCVAAQVAQALR